MRGMMKARKGRIINIASVIGADRQRRARPTTPPPRPASSPSRKSLAKEIGSRGITVNVVAPGFIDTDMTRALPEDAEGRADAGQIALGRLGAAGGHRRAVAFLAGPAAAYITGETLHVNGGMYMAVKPGRRTAVSELRLECAICGCSREAPAIPLDYPARNPTPGRRDYP